MIKWLKRLIALVISEQVFELELLLADRKHALRMAEQRIADLELALAECQDRAVQAGDSW